MNIHIVKQLFVLMLILFATSSCGHISQEQEPIIPIGVLRINLVVIEYTDAPYILKRDDVIWYGAADRSTPSLETLIAYMRKLTKSGRVVGLCRLTYPRPEMVDDFNTMIAGHEFDNHCVQGQVHPDLLIKSR